MKEITKIHITVPAKKQNQMSGSLGLKWQEALAV
jgi:hypothetical protein